MQETITRLQTAFDGQVVTQSDVGYDRARTIFYGGIDRRPAVIVRPRSAAEVAHVVNVAAEAGLPLAVRGGGHSLAGHSTTDGGIVLDLADLKAFEIDPAGRTAWAQTGLTAGEFTAAAAAYGLGTGFGDTGSVGIGGITLGGGVGFVVRKHGLTIDSLLGAEMVTADGRILHVDAETHPDLFWAVRGGGGNFGVATRLRFRLHPLATVVGGMLMLPATPEVIEGFVAEAETAPDELSAIANVMPAPPMPFVPSELHGRMAILALLVYAGDVAAGTAMVDRLRALAPPLADFVAPVPYPQMYMPEEEGFHPTAVGHTMFLDRVDRSVAETSIKRLEASDASMRVLQLRVLGGAAARVPVDATAYAHRHSKIMVNVASFYDGEADRSKRAAEVSDFAAALQQDDHGAYVNFLGDDGAARIRQAYPGATWDRLRTIKRRYDPTNLFRLNHNIPPAPQ